MSATPNLPGPLSELTEACDIYETALMENDLDRLDDLVDDVHHGAVLVEDDVLDHVDLVDDAGAG